MTDAEKIELLKQLRKNTPTRTIEEQEEIDKEVEEIDASIEDYNEQIAALEEKLADPNNYKYDNPFAEEREMTLELLDDSFVDQLQTIERENKEYENLKELGINIFHSYETEIATLNDEIAALERRLRKNDVAVSRNMRMQLSQEELFDLTTELENKKARVVECEKFKSEYVEELRDYETFIEANNRKKELIFIRQDRLEAIKQSRVANASEFDKNKIRLDQDELSRLKAGLVALQNRKQTITYNAADKIDLLIADIEKKSQKSESAINVVGLENGEIEPVVETDQIVDSAVEEIKEDPIVAPIVTPVVEEDLYSPTENDPDYEEQLTEPSDLDEEREAEIEDTKEELLEKKKWQKVKDFLNKHKKKFIAAGIAIVMILVAKGCSDSKDLSKEDLNTSNSLVQQDDIDDEKDDLEIGDNEDIEKEETSKVETEPEPTPDLEPDLELEPTPDLEPDLEPEPTPDLEPDLDNVPENDNPDLMEDNTVELEAGEEVADISDILGGDGERIEHGDEVGTSLDSGVEVKDYTEEGNAVVELPTESETQVVEDTNEKTFHETLEEFFGGPISITDIENSYENGEELTSGRTR